MTMVTRAQTALDEIKGSTVTVPQFQSLVDALLILYYTEPYDDIFADPDNPTNEEKASLVVTFLRNNIFRALDISTERSLEPDLGVAQALARQDFE